MLALLLILLPRLLLIVKALLLVLVLLLGLLLLLLLLVWYGRLRRKRSVQMLHVLHLLERIWVGLLLHFIAIVGGAVFWKCVDIRKIADRFMAH